MNDTPNATTPAVTITGGNLSMGDGTTNNKIVNVAPGTDDTDAVNYKQLKAAKTEVEAGKNVVVTSKTSTADGHTTYTVSASTPAVYTQNQMVISWLNNQMVLSKKKTALHIMVL